MQRNQRNATSYDYRSVPIVLLDAGKPITATIFHAFVAAQARFTHKSKHRLDEQIALTTLTPSLRSDSTKVGQTTVVDCATTGRVRQLNQK